MPRPDEASISDAGPETAMKKPQRGRRRAPVGPQRLSRRVAVICLAVLAVLLLRQHRSSIPTPDGVLVEELSRPGLFFDASDIGCRRPVVAVPGFVTTALEVWGELPCSTRSLTTNFRKRIFGASMLLTLLEDPDCFFQHLALNPETGRDPASGIRLRAGTGLSAVDYVAPGFWVWAKAFRNLADIGYTPRNLVASGFDWRLSPEDLEAAGYFADLRDDIETAVKRSRRAHDSDSNASEAGSVLEADREAEGCDRVVVPVHSYGTAVMQGFIAWVERDEPGWVRRHVHAIAHIGGVTYGLPKAAAAMMSGEFRDTAVLPAPIRRLVDHSLPRQLRTWTFRTWSSLWAMMPRGGRAGWPSLINLTQPDGRVVELDASGVGDVIAAASNASGNPLLAERARTMSDMSSTVQPHMVRAPHTTVYCMYGVNRPTEVGYWYRQQEGGAMVVDADRDDFGITMGNGDGTVPLLSLGYGCRTNATGGWRDRFGSVVTMEFDDPTGPRMPKERAAPEEAAEFNRKQAHEPATTEGWLTGLAGGGRGVAGLFDSAVVDSVVSSFERIGVPDPRGGVGTSDHVDIMGNHEMLRALLHIAAAPIALTAVRVQERVESNIDALVAATDKAAPADSLP